MNCVLIDLLRTLLELMIIIKCNVFNKLKVVWFHERLTYFLVFLIQMEKLVCIYMCVYLILYICASIILYINMCALYMSVCVYNITNLKKMLKGYFICMYIYTNLPRNPIAKLSDACWSWDNQDRETFLVAPVDDHIFAR